MAKAALFLFVFLGSSAIGFAWWYVMLMAIFEPGGSLSLYIQQRTRGVDLLVVGAILFASVGAISALIITRGWGKSK